MSEPPQPPPDETPTGADLGFDYRSSKDGTVFISRYGKTVTTLRGKRAEQFLARLAGLDEQGAQLAMAKITGNFKHGNERQAKRASRR